MLEELWQDLLDELSDRQHKGKVMPKTISVKGCSPYQAGR